MSFTNEIANFNASMEVTELLMKTLENAARKLAARCISEAATRHGFDADKEIQALGLENLSVARKQMVRKAVSEKKEKKPREPKKSVFPMPFFAENVNSDGCQGLAYNRGLFTQCTKDRLETGDYCKGCQTETDKNPSGCPDCGNVSSRLDTGLYEFKDTKGRKPTSYVKLLKKLNITLEQVSEETGKQGKTIPLEHLVVAEKKRSAATGRGRPKKVNAVETDDMSVVSDLFSKLSVEKKQEQEEKEQEQKENNEEVVLQEEEEEEVLECESPVKTKKPKLSEDEKAEKKRVLEAEKEAKKLALEAEKEAKAALEAEKAEKKRALEAEKEAEKAEKKRALEAEKEAEKAEKKRVLEAEKAEKKRALEVEKAEKKEAEKAERLAKREAEKAQKKKPDKKVEKVEKVDDADETPPPVEPEPVPLPEPEPVPLPEPEPVPKNTVKVSRIQIAGKSYLKTSNNLLYNPETKEEVGIWDPDTKTIKPLPEEEDEEEQEEEYDSDSN
jgi:hypothetical protein